MKKSTLIGALLIIGFLAIGAMGWVKSLTPYVSIAEAKKSPTTVQAKGALLKDTISFDKEGALNFYIRDDSTGERLKVAYDGAKPGNLEQASHVVAVGTYHDGAFRADRLIVKCPSKYQGTTSGGN
ncbi:MAG: cytochrome c maturation protein CcmE [Armatimonadota bacterium]|nr:cytochrome c maturation protein CcmE [Armatimonadota bacterium]